MTRALAFALVLGGLACTRPGASVAPEGADAKGSTPGPSEGAPPGDDPSASHALSVDALPPWLRAMFDPRLRRTYTWTYEVDTHSTEEEDAIARAQGKLHCRSDGPTRHELGDGRVALVSCEVCDFTSEGQNDGFEPELQGCYVATAEGLWIVGAPPNDDEEARSLVATLPYLLASPEPRHESHEREEDGFPFEEWTAVAEQEVEVMGRSVEAWCREDGSTLFYGWSMNRCFAPGFGLFALEWNGRGGPSVESYALIEIAPLP